MLAKKKTKVVVVESELAKFGKMLVNFVRGSRARGPSRARLARAALAR